MFQKRTGRLSRFLDRSVGVLLLLFISIFLRKRIKPDNPQSFCFIKTGGVGDMVLLSAVIGQVRSKYPSANMTLVCSPENREMAEYMTDCRVIAVSHKNPVQWFSLCRLEKADVLIDFGAWARFDAFLSMFVPSDFRMGFKTEKQYRHFCYDHTVKHSRDKHELDNYYALAEDFCAQTGVLPECETEPDNSVKDMIIMHMYCAGARYMCRMWSFDNWEKLAKLIKNNGFYLGFTSYGTESDHLKAFLHGKCITAQVIADRSPDGLASKFCSCRGVVSVNSGISHFASACGAKVLELTGSVNPKRWGTLGNQIYHVIPPDVKKMLCYGYEKSADENSMDSVTPEEVFEMVKKVFPL